MRRLGLKDMPITHKNEETLGLQDYAIALSEFVQSCETPLTISIQGDWGSGKTSLMNLMKEHVEEQNNVGAARIKTIWFNTWQYSQFNLEEYLAISLISYFAKELSEQKSEKVKKLLGTFVNIAKAGTITVASLAGVGDAAKEALAYLDPEKRIDVAMQVKELKDNLENLVKEIIGDKPGQFERIVVFIDDLDRLVPSKAVDFLEVFKLFLDIENCVFILACDYNVVMQGLQQKFGVGEKELKGKSFFDKIIQLPFSMPVGTGNRREYISDLLNKINAHFEDDDLDDYEELIDKSVGFNPRNMKRIFNSLLLLNIVAQKKNLFYGEENNKIATGPEIQKILFASLCMQIAYEPVYQYLIKHRNAIDQEFFNGFINYKDLLNDIDSLVNNYPYLVELSKALEDDADHTTMQKLSSFMQQFFNTLHLKQLGSKDELLPEEKDNLSSILSFSSITSIKTHGSIDDSLSDKKKGYYEFFTAIKNDLEKADFIKIKKITPKNFITYASSKNRATFNLAFLSQDQFGIELVLSGDKESNKETFDRLYSKKEQIENGLGQVVIWERWDAKNNSKLGIRCKGAVDDSKEELAVLKKWCIENAILFYNVLEKYL